jgi:hypothetical protein
MAPSSQSVEPPQNPGRFKQSRDLGECQFATADVSGKKIGNLKLPVILEHEVKTRGGH